MDWEGRSTGDPQSQVGFWSNFYLPPFLLHPFPVFFSPQVTVAAPPPQVVSPFNPPHPAEELVTFGDFQEKTSGRYCRSPLGSRPLRSQASWRRPSVWAPPAAAAAAGAAKGLSRRGEGAGARAAPALCRPPLSPRRRGAPASAARDRAGRRAWRGRRRRRELERDATRRGRGCGSCARPLGAQPARGGRAWWPRPEARGTRLAAPPVPRPPPPAPPSACPPPPVLSACGSPGFRSPGAACGAPSPRRTAPLWTLKGTMRLAWSV